MKATAFGLEAQLLKWSGETSSTGPIVVLLLKGDEDLEPFKTMTLAKKGVAGQRLAIAVSEIGDDEKPVAHEVSPLRAMAAFANGAAAKAERMPSKGFPGGFCGLAVRWCDDEHFQKWLAFQHADAWKQSIEYPGAKPAPAERAAWVVKAICGVSTRKFLDTQHDAKVIFEREIRGPYMAAMAADPLNQRPPFAA